MLFAKRIDEPKHDTKFPFNNMSIIFSDVVYFHDLLKRLPIEKCI